MHYRGTDEHGLVHYVDKVWHREVAGYLYAPWCVMGREKVLPPLAKCLLTPSKPRNQAVTCLFCLHLRGGARSGRTV